MLESPPQFQRFYVCLDACKKGFKAGCRPLIGLDRAFLKNLHEGQILTACGQDANNHVYKNILLQYESNKGANLWEKTDSSAPVPPQVKIKSGRPTMNRRKDKDEQPVSSKTWMKRKYNPIRCLYYGEVGHNRRTCKVKKQEKAAEQARLMQLQLAVVAAPADANAQHAPRGTPIDPVAQDPTNPPAATSNAPTEMILDQSDGPLKLYVKKGKATTLASPQPAAAATIPVSAETIKGTSSATAKKLASLMIFVPTLGFKHPRKKDKDTELPEENADGTAASLKERRRNCR
ncbi:hypothetical protein Ahy_A04g021042 [Arachis hypogaea]|uniref:Uncharacterized protein n=1 Tax=Arachis hypogaea TaxID=3818 RepID=A0A445DJ79_ARAHY|nr:hypothetical protein Ahy_A04g021042 [Arachis hypogaea]